MANSLSPGHALFILSPSLTSTSSAVLEIIWSKPAFFAQLNSGLIWRAIAMQIEGSDLSSARTAYGVTLVASTSL